MADWNDHEPRNQPHNYQDDRYLTPHASGRPLSRRYHTSKSTNNHTRPSTWYRDYYSDNESRDHDFPNAGRPKRSSRKQVPSPPPPAPAPPRFPGNRDDGISQQSKLRRASPPLLSFNLSRETTRRQRSQPHRPDPLPVPYSTPSRPDPGVYNDSSDYDPYLAGHRVVKHAPSQRESSPASPPRIVAHPPPPTVERYFKRIPSPPLLDRRSKSAKDVRLTHMDATQPNPPTGGRPRAFSAARDQPPGMKVRRSDRSPSQEVPSSMPGGFPYAPDTVKPDDSRSEPSQSYSDQHAWPSRPASVTLSGSTSRPSLPPASSSGVLGLKSYQYSPLQELEFRLVRILPARMSTIKCEILHASLENPPAYIAVSYAWGDADDTRKIYVEGASIRVAVSLHGALEALREKKEAVLVWVDALSIDQQNRDERTQQVQLMTAIYMKASCVAIWLGPQSDDSDLAIEIIDEVAASADDSRKIASILKSRAQGPDFAAVVSLFERSYWQRLWVVQEVFNARDITVYCGTLKLPWTAYRLASNVFWRHKNALDQHLPTGLSHGSDQRSSQDQFTYSQVLVYQGPGSLPNIDSFRGLGEESLLEVMRACRRKLSADARDKVFGILGLLPEEIRDEFPVDYNLSVKEVYINVVDYLLSTTERLDVICESIHFPLHTSSANLPSWVPDWSHIPETNSLGRSFHFTAAGSSKAQYRLLDERRKLEISAIYLDTVSAHGIAVGTLCTLADYLMAFLHWRALLLGRHEAEEDGDSYAAEEAFCTTLCLDQVPLQWSEPHKWLPICYYVFSSLLRERLPRLRLDSELRRYADAKVDLPPEERRRFLQENFGARMMGRCFCLTRNGYTGIGSGFMSAGDVIVVPLGCSTPVILRPSGPRSEYRFVGDVYIHGYMYGKAMEQLEAGKAQISKYVLH